MSVKKSCKARPDNVVPSQAQPRQPRRWGRRQTWSLGRVTVRLTSAETPCRAAACGDAREPGNAEGVGRGVLETRPAVRPVGTLGTGRAWGKRDLETRPAMGLVGTLVTQEGLGRRGLETRPAV